MINFYKNFLLKSTGIYLIEPFLPWNHLLYSHHYVRVQFRTWEKCLALFPNTPTLAAHKHLQVSTSIIVSVTIRALTFHFENTQPTLHTGASRHSFPSPTSRSSFPTIAGIAYKPKNASLN